MGRGIGAHANLVVADERNIMYEYGGYNLNDPEYKNGKHIYDGIIQFPENVLQNLKYIKKGRKCWNKETCRSISVTMYKSRLL